MLSIVAAQAALTLERAAKEERAWPRKPMVATRKTIKRGDNGRRQCNAAVAPERFDAFNVYPPAGTGATQTRVVGSSGVPHQTLSDMPNLKPSLLVTRSA